MKPMLATLAERVPTGPEWVHEVKWDGMRVLADVRAGRVTLYARSGNDVTASYPELGGLGEDYDDMLLDGEVVARAESPFRAYLPARPGDHELRVRAAQADLPLRGDAIHFSVR